MSPAGMVRSMGSSPLRGAHLPPRTRGPASRGSSPLRGAHVLRSPHRPVDRGSSPLRGAHETLERLREQGVGSSPLRGAHCGAPCELPEGHGLIPAARGAPQSPAP